MICKVLSGCLRSLGRQLLCLAGYLVRAPSIPSCLAFHVGVLGRAGFGLCFAWSWACLWFGKVDKISDSHSSHRRALMAFLSSQSSHSRLRISQIWQIVFVVFTWLVFVKFGNYIEVILVVVECGASALAEQRFFRRSFSPNVASVCDRFVVTGTFFSVSLWSSRPLRRG